MLFDGTGPEYAKRAIEEIIAESPTDAVRRGRLRFGHDIMLNLGRPNDALRLLRASLDTGFDSNVAIILVRDATVGEGSRTEGENAAKLLAPLELREPRDSASREVQRAAIRVLEVWRLSRGDTSRTRASLQRLRSFIPIVEKKVLLPLQTEIAFIEMLHADIAKSPGLRAATERLDSLIALQDIGSIHTGREANMALELARIFERLGDPGRARAALGRMPVWGQDAMPYFGRQIRELARLAAVNGDKPRAIRRYRHYLNMRAIAEPALKPQIDSARSELAALEKGG
jgi:hypothetical protein